MAHSTILRFQPVPTMLIFLSPAKSLDFTTPPHVATFTQPGYLQQSETLIRQLRQLSPADIAKLMNALHTPEVKKFIQEKYKGAVVPAF